MVREYISRHRDIFGGKDPRTSSRAEGGKDVHQLQREQNEKMEKLTKAFSFIQQAMLRNNLCNVIV